MYLITGAGGGIGSISRRVVQLLLDGGARVDVSGCADPLSELNDALYAPPPPPPAPNVSVCVNAGRRISVSGCI